MAKDPIELGNGVGEWLSGTGPESDIVISTRIRLAERTSYNFATEKCSEVSEFLEQLALLLA